MKYGIIIALMALTLSILSFISSNLDTNFSAKITKKSAPIIINKISDKNVLHINSYGGLNTAGLDIADEIYYRDVTVIVDSYCISACSEFLLPAAKNVIFKDKPLIGFHGNAITYRHYGMKLTRKQRGFCRWGNAYRQTVLYENKKLNVEFWEEQMMRLKPNVSFTFEDRRCPKIHYNFKHEMWYPTSEQLRELLGLKFEGEVCADDQDCVNDRLVNKFPPNRTMVVGDKVVKTNTLWKILFTR